MPLVIEALIKRPYRLPRLSLSHPFFQTISPVNSSYRVNSFAELRSLPCHRLPNKDFTFSPGDQSTSYNNAPTIARKPPSSPPLTAGLANAAPAVDDADAALPLAELLPEAEEEEVLLLRLLLSVPVVSDESDEAEVPLAPVAEAPADEEVKEVTEAFPDEVPVALALPLLPVSEAVAEKETHWAEPADWAWARSPALQLLSRQLAAWAPISDWEAQAQAWSVAGVQTAEMAEVRQGVAQAGWPSRPPWAAARPAVATAKRMADFMMFLTG